MNNVTTEQLVSGSLPLQGLQSTSEPLTSLFSEATSILEAHALIPSQVLAAEEFCMLLVHRLHSFSQQRTSSPLGSWPEGITTTNSLSETGVSILTLAALQSAGIPASLGLCCDRIVILAELDGDLFWLDGFHNTIEKLQTKRTRPVKESPLFYLQERITNYGAVVQLPANFLLSFLHENMLLLQEVSTTSLEVDEQGQQAIESLQQLFASPAVQTLLEEQALLLSTLRESSELQEDRRLVPLLRATTN